jgi:RNA polymerase sigma-70 factor (ECF subfamily)
MDERPEFIPTRQSLLTRLKQWNDQESWRDFFDTYWQLVYRFARQSGLSDAEAQDVVQETVISVARKIPSFTYDPVRGSFKAWLMQLTRRRSVDQFRKRPREAELPGANAQETGTAPAERLPDPAGIPLEKVWEGEWQKHLLDTALQRVKNRAAPAQYQLFELHVLKEWPVDRVTTTLQVTANQVYLAKGRIGKLLQTELRRLEAELG